MKRLFHTSLILFFTLVILFANPYTVSANEGDNRHNLETEVNGYHVTLTSQGEWAKGENTVIVTLADGMGMPVSNADVEILITPKSNQHIESETDSHGVEQPNSMPGMDMGASATEVPDLPAHDEEMENPIPMIESDEHGMYMLETHLESSGEHEVQVFFHINGEMLRADFMVEIPGTGSKAIVLWSFVVINVGLITSAAVLKKQSIPVKGGR